MKISKNKQTIGILGILTVSLIALTACAPSSVSASSDNPKLIAVENVTNENESLTQLDLTSVDEEGTTMINDESLDEALTQIASGGLTQQEMDGLLFMREEEKLAHDVYVTLYEIWGLPIFQNIAQSEQTHTDAVLKLINQYGLDDPAATTGIGEFVNPALQNLYTQLVAQGSQSLVDALKVGGAIEEIDILDLEQHIAETENDAIILVYQNLLKGSRNHLRAFVSTLENRAGDTYLPQYLSSEVLDGIMSAGIESGGNRNGQNRNQGKGS